MDNYLPNFKNCLQKEVPFCRAECPFHIDILEFIEKLRRGSFKAAYKTYRNAVGFPEIVSHLCDAPCQSVCPRKDTDQSINLHLLERACLDYTKDKDPADYNLPKKKGAIGIVGGGISGLACALRLATKKYDVTIFEKSHRIGGHLWDRLDSKLFLTEIENQFKHENYDLHLNTEISSLSQLDSHQFDALYIATGAGGNAFGLLAENREEPCLIHEKTGVFAGGSLLGKSSIYAIADGLNMSTTIDNYLKTKNLIYTKDYRDTAMCLDPSHLKKEPAVVPTAQNYTFTKEEAQREASRCLECQCDACRVHCDLTEFFNKWPLRIRDEIQATTLPGSAEVKATPAKRLISTCNQCGLCVETCPEDVDLGGLILAARKSMHNQKKAPWPFHDFWMRDMEFANGPFSQIARTPKGQDTCTYAFFPGCQLGASDPDLVSETYNYLLQQEPSMGLIVQCCGVPGQWSGDDDKFHNALNQLETSWESLGRPTLVLACPTCSRTLKKHLPHIPVTFVYEQIAGVKLPQAGSVSGPYSIFDPCSTRGNDALRAAVRQIVRNTGAQLVPLTWQEEHSHCCGYGGQVSIANPEFTDFVTKKRIAEGPHPYITYCINCRDTFLQEGKDSVHILGLLLNRPKPSKLPTVSQRRDNRVLLKEALLERFWDEKMDIRKRKYDFELVISQELQEKISKDRILVEEIYNVIAFCESTGRTVYNTESNTFTGYRQIGHMTYWVEYRKMDDHIVLMNAYSHRMKIELEAVWNGEKVDLTVQ